MAREYGANPLCATPRARIAVIGGGALGLPVAQSLAKQHAVWVVRRSTMPPISNIDIVQADVTRAETLSALPAELEVVIYCLSPSTSDDSAYRAVFVDGLHNLVHHLKTTSPNLRRLVFVSSTSVYGQDDDGAVDEGSACHPTGFSGQRLREGEQILETSKLPFTVIRFSGIYGPTRQRLLTQIRNGIASTSTTYSNRIHEHDAIAALGFLAQRALDGKTLDNNYVGSDCEPVRMAALIAWVAERIGVEGREKDAAPSARRAGSKQCNNQRLRDTGFVFRYPSFREGYGEMLGLTE